MSAHSTSTHVPRVDVTRLLPSRPTPRWGHPRSPSGGCGTGSGAGSGSELAAASRDAGGARTGLGEALDVWSTTATIQYKIWRGLVGRVEYRHDQANAKVFKLENHGTTPTRGSQDTISASLYYLFF